MIVSKGSPYFLEVRYALLQRLRIPGEFFGIPLGGVAAFGLLLLMGRDFGENLLIGFAALGVINIGLLAVGLGAASERAQGWIRLRQVSPMPPLAYFLGKLFIGAAMAAISALGALLLGLVFAGVSLPYSSWVLLPLTLVLGSLPFAALGLALAYLVRPNSAQLIIAYTAPLLLFPVFMPLLSLPGWVGTIFAYLPSSLLINLALGAAGLAQPSLFSLVLLTAYAAGFLLLAAWLYSRDEGSTFG
jgi:ABC-2 type transport system permease protein